MVFQVFSHPPAIKYLLLWFAFTAIHPLFFAFSHPPAICPQVARNVILSTSLDYVIPQVFQRVVSYVLYITTRYIIVTNMASLTSWAGGWRKKTERLSEYLQRTATGNAVMKPFKCPRTRQAIVCQVYVMYVPGTWRLFLDKLPWSHVSSLLAPGTCLHFIAYMFMQRLSPLRIN